MTIRRVGPAGSPSLVEVLAHPCGAVLSPSLVTAMYVTDTIAAIATPPGSGGVGIVRISGADAARIGAQVFRSSAEIDSWQSHRLYRGQVVDGSGQPLDSGLAVLMRGPHSYTGEDVLELQCHGSALVLRAVLAAVLQCGARAAQPGELTKRAFLNGRIDLTQAEAVRDLIEARSSGAAGVALDQLEGALSRSLESIRAHLLQAKALLEVQIDFSEEDVAVDRAAIRREVELARTAVERLADTYTRGRLLREGLRVALVGKPNVGKSSLLNALLGVERAIVTDVAGTTRDTIEETLCIAGIPIVLVDTAGLRAATGDVVERIGMQRTQDALAAADVVVVVLDASQPLDDADHAVLAQMGFAIDTPPEPPAKQGQAGPRTVLALNKVDLLQPADPLELDKSPLAPLFQRGDCVRTSAATGAGLEELRTAIIASTGVADDRGDNDVIVSNARHHAALLATRDSLILVLDSLAQRQPADVVAVDVQDAMDHLGSITGVISNEDVLDRIFSEFCIGK